MAAWTALSGEDVLYDPANPKNVVVSGLLYEDMAPGTWVVYDSANEYWIKLNTGTSTTGQSHKLGRVGVVGYRKRVRASSGALVAITDNWDVSETEDKVAPIILSGIVQAKILDQNAIVSPGFELMASSTGGSATIRAIAATGASGGNALLQTAIGSIAAPVADDDTVAWCAIGARIGEILPAGVNA